MWLVALLGMGTAFAEASLAVRFREKDALGNMIGGPMYYIRKGLGEKWKWLAFSFALFGMTAGFGIGNTVQSNSVADALNHSFGIHPVITGIVTAILVGLVLLGGIRRIGDVAGKLVPIMATAYIASGLVILGLYWQEIPSAIMTIVESSFYACFRRRRIRGRYRMGCNPLRGRTRYFFQRRREWEARRSPTRRLRPTARPVRERLPCSASFSIR